ncbi:hypothetical protein Ahy_B05g079214 [Arachis hypogaea]|uniref:PB1-like domain-containing protein n=1 Tax=Arachis hypogaea TaxID=3818 RepID=A0A444Z993_ARAHY|nr:hypothetical protein Ahy_B05g079214 [Arachis hypogaea]
MEERMDIMIHHGGDFKKIAEGIMVYSPDNKACLGDLDTDTLDVFYVRNYHKELGYNDIKQFWWHIPGKGLDNGLRNVNSDKEIREIVNCFRTNDGLIDVYFEHGVSVLEVLEGDNTVVYLDDVGGEGCNATTDANVSPPLNETHALIVAPTPKSQQKQYISTANTTITLQKILILPRQPTLPRKLTPQRQRSPVDSSSPPSPRKPPEPASPRSPVSTKSDKSNKQKLSKRSSIFRRPCTRSVVRGFRSKVFNNEVSFDVSSDSSDSEEDSLFKPGPDDGSSSDSEAAGNDPKTGSRIRKNMVHAEVGSRNVNPLGKGKEKILHEDDGLVQEVSDVEVDLGLVGCVDEGAEDGLDPSIL